VREQIPDERPGEGVTTTSASTGREQRTGRASRLRLFLRQVVAELKKVVRPTRNELLTYFTVVLVFVCAVMTYVALLDFGFGKLVLRVFGGS
jgi:preprotein translocase subunit SecE